MGIYYCLVIDAWAYLLEHKVKDSGGLKFAQLFISLAHVELSHGTYNILSRFNAKLNLFHYLPLLKCIILIRILRPLRISLWP